MENYHDYPPIKLPSISNMEPILPFTRWLSIQFMRDEEIRNLKRQIRRTVIGIPRPLNLPGKRPTEMLLPRVEPHNCHGMCGVKTNWLVWEQVDVETKKHIGNWGMCLNCADECDPESGSCDYPDAGWGVYEPTFDEHENARKVAEKVFNNEITQREYYAQRYALPNRPPLFCTPWQR